MAEFCVECYNKLNRTNYRKNDVWTEVDFCECCADWKPCIVELRPKPIFWRIIDGLEELYYRFKKDEE